MHVPKTDEKGESKSKACNFMNVVEAQRLLRPLAVIMFSMSPGIFFFLVSLSYMLPLLGTGSQDGSIGMVAPPGNQLYTGSEAFTSVLKLWMVLIFHDELPQPNEKERDEGGARKQETERENPGGILCLHSLGAFSVLVEYCTFLWQAYLHSPTHASLSNRMKSQRRSSFIQSERACSCACTPPLN